MAKKITNKKTPKLGEITGSQKIGISYGIDELSRNYADYGTYAEYRLLRKDPTIALGRNLLVSGVCSGAWSVEGSDNVDDKFIDSIKTLLPLRDIIMASSVSFGRVDFGWMPFEKVFGVKDGLIVIDRLKPLLHDMTTVLIDDKGHFKGYRQNPVSGTAVDVPVDKCLHIAFDVEGGNYYGVPLLENVRETQDMWKDCNSGARQYDKKIAGSHFIVHFPPGTSEIDGETVENSEVARQIISALEASGSMAMPSTTADNIQELSGTGVANLYKWDVTLLSDTSPRQPSFNDRLRYLDTLKMRGLLIPERSATEGQMGTKAEAETHLGVAITLMQEIDQYITRQINDQIVNQLLVLNYGIEASGSVKLVSSPLIDLQSGFLRKLYLALLSGNTEAATVDTQALKELLSIPIVKDKTDG